MGATEEPRSYRLAILAIALWLLATGPAAAVELALDGLFGETADLHTCGVHVTGSDSLFSFSGVGVVGGVSDFLLDGTEWVEFDFDEPQTGVYFDVRLASDEDSDGVAGRAIVQAFDAAGLSLGFQMIQETGLKDLAGLYGASPMSRVVVTPVGDGIRIGRLGYSELGTVEIDLRDGGYQDTSIYEPIVCDVRVVGSGQVYYSDTEGSGGGGLGVVGGEGANLLDGSEWMRLEFPYPVDELVLESLLYGLDADFFYGEAVLFAYDESGASLGSTSLSRHSLFGGPISHTVDVVDRLGVGGIAEIEIYSLGDARRLDKVIYAPEPGMGAGAALLALVSLARRRSRATTV